MKLAAAAAVLTLAATGARADALDEVFTAYARLDAPGCAVGVARDGQPTVTRGYGSADLEHRVAITPDTVFEAGSVAKQFTAAAILTLVQDGKLQLTDDVRTYVPELPDYGRPITVDQLLNHTSGLRDWGEVAALAGWPRTSRVYTAAEVLAITTRQKALNYEPGAEYSYTNTGYNLAGLIVQRVSGRSLAEFTRDRFFTPLGMGRTQWRDNFRQVVPDRAIAYQPAAGGGHEQLMPFEDTYGHGALLTTVGDLLTWNDALAKGRLGPVVTQRIQERSKLNDGRQIAYARGLFVQTHRGAREVSHGGATAGYRAWLGRYPDQGVSIALLCNSARANTGELAHRVADLHLPASSEPAAPSVTPQSPAAEELASRPGAYVDERTGAIVRLVSEEGRLRFASGPALDPLSAGRYRAGVAEVVFVADGMERRMPDGEVVAYRRATPHAPSAGELAAIAGDYASDEAGATYQLRVRDGVLWAAPADRPSAGGPLKPLYRDAFSAGGDLMRLVRGKDGKVEAIRFTGQRVRDLRFHRLAGS